MKQIDEIFYDALMADNELKAACGYRAPQGEEDPGSPARIKSTCFEVSPTADSDNTPLPCIIVMDDGFQNSNDTKDDDWESTQDDWVVSIEVNAKKPKTVDELVDRVRYAIGRYIKTLPEDERPQLTSVSSNGKAWDWTKPCYHSTITYRCSTNYDNSYEQESENE